MRKHVSLSSILPLTFLLATGCGDYLDLEPDNPSPPDAAPDAPPDYPPLPPPAVFPDEPVVTTPGEAPAPPPGDVDDGVHLVFPPPVSMTTAHHVTVRGTARLAGGVTAVRINGVDARLSPPGAQGAVAWQADVQVTRDVSELVVSAVDGSGTVLPAAATAEITFAPDMLVRPGAMALDVGHDRLLVADRMQGIVAIDLATGTPTGMRLEGTADGPVSPYSLSIDAATGRALGLFMQRSCADALRQEVSGVAGIDLRDGSTVVTEELERYPDCESLSTRSFVNGRSVVLRAGSQSFFYIANACEDGDCHAAIRRRELGASGSPPADVSLCPDTWCEAPALLADAAGSGLFALVALIDGQETSFEVRAIDPVAGIETRVIPVQTVHDGMTYLPWSMVLDAAGNRLLLLAYREEAPVDYPGGLSLLSIDLATGDQSLLFAYLTTVDGSDSWAIADAVHDPRRNRLILSDETRGLVALDLANGAASLLLRPAIGEGPVLPCTFGRSCSVSNLDLGRQRFFVHVPTVDDIGEIYTVDLATGSRRLLSPRNSPLRFDSGPRLLADDVEDRLLVVHYDGSLYSVDGATGERSSLGTVPAFESRFVAWDPAQNRILYYSEPDGHALRAFHVDTGEDRVISSDTVGSGPSLLLFVPDEPDETPLPWERTMMVTLDPGGTRAFLSQFFARSLFSVDLATGNRTSLPVNEPATRPAEIPWPHPVLFDARRNQLLVGDFVSNALGAIDLATGATSVFLDYYRTDPPLRLARDLIPDHANDRALFVEDWGEVHMLDLQTGQGVLIMPSRKPVATFE